MSVGYIYILSNHSMVGLLKIGFTNRDVKERADELSSSTGVPTAFEIEYYCLTPDVEEIESKVHSHFSAQRKHSKHGRREFFAITLSEAVILIDSLVKPLVPDRFSKIVITPALAEEQIGQISRITLSCPKCGKAYLATLVRHDKWSTCPHCHQYHTVVW